MILTGKEIARRRELGEICIEPYSPECLEPNSYGVHLGSDLLVYNDDVLEPFGARATTLIQIPEEGLVIFPGRIYLGHTYERIGGVKLASELYANHATASAGLFIQTSAPLGHAGAVVNWTLEMVAAQPIRVFVGMPLGKVCFWESLGEHVAYSGRYKDSSTVVASKFGDGL